MGIGCNGCGSFDTVAMGASDISGSSQRNRLTVCVAHPAVDDLATSILLLADRLLKDLTFSETIWTKGGFEMKLRDSC